MTTHIKEETLQVVAAENLQGSVFKVLSINGTIAQTVREAIGISKTSTSSGQLRWRSRNAGLAADDHHVGLRHCRRLWQFDVRSPRCDGRALRTDRLRSVRLQQPRLQPWLIKPRLSGLNSTTRRLEKLWDSRQAKTCTSTTI
jgi:hypothetical protein